jgi:hypothetical protein
MVYIVICGVLLGIFILKLKDEFHSQNYASKERKKRKSILEDIYGDLVHLFYYKKPGKFIGPLAPLNDLNILNNLVMVEDNESYTINKKVIHLCTKDPQNGTYYDRNTLMFVVLHELAHVLCTDVGHTDNFSIINQALLDHAIRCRFYDPSKPFVENYCKLK